MGAGRELYGRAKDGREFPVEISLSPVETGGEVWIAAAVRDISERQRMVQALRTNEERFRDFAAVAADWFWEMDDRLRFTYLSERYQSVTGIAPGQVLGRAREELPAWVRSKPGAWQTLLTELSARRPFADIEYDLPTPGGETPIVSNSGKPLFDRDGRFLGYRGASRDVTARRRAQQALRAEKTFSERLLDIAPVIILLLDEQGRIRRFNPHLETLTGYRAAEVIGRDWFEHFIPHADREAMQAFFRSVISEGVNRGFVNPILTRAGARREIEWYGRTLSDASGGPMLLNVGYDVTELRASARALTLAKRHAERANATRSRFLAAASHDLRQPLQTLELLNGTLRRRIGTAETAIRAALDKQTAATSAMNQMLDSLLNLHQLEQGAIRPAIAAFALAPLFDSVRATFTDLAARATARRPLGPIPARSPAPARTLDRNQLRPLISGLCSRAGDCARYHAFPGRRR